MATIYTFLDKQMNVNAQHDGEYFVKKVKLDFSARPIVTNDVVQALSIEADTFVRDVFLHIETIEGATCTVDVGDATADGWLNGVSANATADTVFCASLDAGNGAYATGANNCGKYFGSADTIDLTAKNNCNNCVLDIAALCIRMKNLR